MISMPHPRHPQNHEIIRNSSCFGSSFSSSSTGLHSDVAPSQFVSTATVAIATTTTTTMTSSSKPLDKPRIWSLADVATSVTPPGDGSCYRRHVVNPTSQSVSAATDLQSLPPRNDHVTSEQRSCPPIRASPVVFYRSFQPWTSVTSLPLHDAASAPMRLGLVANGNAVFCGLTEQRESNRNVPVPSDIHSNNGKYDSRHDFIVSVTCRRCKA